MKAVKLLGCLAVMLAVLGVMAHEAVACRVIPSPMPIMRPETPARQPLETRSHSAEITIKGPIAQVAVNAVCGCLPLSWFPASVAGEAQPFTRVYEAEGFKIEAGFVPEDTEIILGQPLLATFVVTNRSEKPYTFSTGGAYRGSVRDNNFRITATNAKGQPVRDPHSYMNFGGIGGSEELESGDTYTKRLYLGLWCAFDEPGEYAVTCERSLSHFPAITTTFKLVVAPYDRERMQKAIAALGRRVRETEVPDGKELHDLVAKQHPELEGKRLQLIERKLRGERQEALTEATRALAAIQDDGVIPHLAASLAKGSFANQIPAIEGLSRFPTDASATALRLALSSPDHAVREAAGRALQQVQKTDGAVDALLKDLSAEEAPRRAVAARALGATGSRRALEPLIAALKDTDASVREQAAEAIGALGRPEGIPMLQQLLMGEDLPLRVAAAKGLLALKQPLPVDRLTPVVRGSGVNDHHFHEAIRVTRLYGGPQAASALVSCVRLDDPSVRNSYNMYLILAIESCPGGPKHYYQWHSDPNTDGTAQQVEGNRKILAELKAWLDKPQKPRE